MQHVQAGQVPSDLGMAGCCLLEDVPASRFRAILQQLSSQDHANLRHVSKAVCKRTTEHVPCITLRLGDSSSTDQLQQWCQNARQLQHAPEIQVWIDGKASAEVFETAMHLLAQHTSATTLYLQAAAATDSSSSSNSRRKRVTGVVPTLLPVKHLLPQLTCLIIEDIVFDNLANDLQQLAAAADSWQLQNLSLSAYWYPPRVSWYSPAATIPWSRCAAALLNLTSAFPHLIGLYIVLPDVDVSDRSGSVHPGVIATGSSTAAVDPHVKGQLAMVAVVAAVANAAMHLKSLQWLRVFRVPDIWCPGTRIVDNCSIVTPSAAATAAATTPVSVAAFADAVLVQGPLCSVTAAGAAFITLDDCGCWLLQHHSSLQGLDICASGLGLSTSMAWQQQQSCDDSDSSCSNSNTRLSTTTSGVALPDIMYMIASYDYYDAKQFKQYNSVRFDNCDSNGGRSPMATEFLIRLSAYSFRPLGCLPQTLACLWLKLPEETLVGLAGILDDLKSLKHLEITPYCWSRPKTYHHVVASAVAAAAAVPGLQSLVVIAQDGQHVLPVDLLQPLTAAVGGTGSSLTSLELHGNFIPGQYTRPAGLHAKTSVLAADVADTTAEAASRANTSTSTSADSATDGYHGMVGLPHPPAKQQQPQQQAPAEPAWHHGLQHLKQLRNLHINHTGSNKLQLSVRCLPTSLQVLEGSRLSITDDMCTAAEHDDASYAAGLSATGTAAITNDNGTGSTETPLSEVLHAGPQLQKMHITQCDVNSPSILASHRMRDLIVIDSTWDYGWAPAAVAWPNVRRLCWSCNIPIEKRYLITGSTLCHQQLPVTMGDCSCSSSEAKAPDIVRSQFVGAQQLVVMEMQDLCTGFKHLKSVAVTHLPCSLVIEDLQPLVQLQCIQKIELGFDNNTEAECMALQDWLQQRLPWAGVVIGSQ